jgi:hypothetical protein
MALVRNPTKTTSHIFVGHAWNWSLHVGVAAKAAPQDVCGCQKQSVGFQYKVESDQDGSKFF